MSPDYFHTLALYIIVPLGLKSALSDPRHRPCVTPLVGYSRGISRLFSTTVPPKKYGEQAQVSRYFNHKGFCGGCVEELHTPAAYLKTMVILYLELSPYLELG